VAFGTTQVPCERAKQSRKITACTEFGRSSASKPVSLCSI
jgi:hypothetical protein